MPDQPKRSIISSCGTPQRIPQTRRWHWICKLQAPNPIRRHFRPQTLQLQKKCGGLESETIRATNGLLVRSHHCTAAVHSVTMDIPMQRRHVPHPPYSSTARCFFGFAHRDVSCCPGDCTKFRHTHMSDGSPQRTRGNQPCVQTGHPTVNHAKALPSMCTQPDGKRFAGSCPMTSDCYVPAVEHLAPSSVPIHTAACGGLYREL